MQRFVSSELEALEHYLAKIGFQVTEVKRHEKEGKPPLATYILRGRGSSQAVQQALLDSPFLLTDFSSRPVEGGLSLRMLFSRREVAAPKPVLEPEFGDGETGPVRPFHFESEMGDDE